MKFEKNASWGLVEHDQLISRYKINVVEGQLLYYFDE